MCLKLSEEEGLPDVKLRVKVRLEVNFKKVKSCAQSNFKANFQEALLDLKIGVEQRWPKYCLRAN